MTNKKNFIEDALAEKQCVLERVEGLDMDNNPIFAYVVLKKNSLKAFQKALAERDVDLSEFGVVVAQGNGTEPSGGFKQAILDAIQKAA
jgi:hypothetical protein